MPCAACQPTIFCCFIGSNAVLLGAIPDSLSRALSSGCTISVKQEQFCVFFTDEFEGLQIIVATWNHRKHVHRKKLTPDDIDMCAHWAHTSQIDLIQTAAGQWYVNENHNGKIFRNNHRHYRSKLIDIKFSSDLLCFLFFSHHHHWLRFDCFCNVWKKNIIMKFSLFQYYLNWNYRHHYRKKMII